MIIKKGDIFDLYEDSEETKRCIAVEDSFKGKVFYISFDKTLATNDKVRWAIIEGNIEGKMCNINDLED